MDIKTTNFYYIMTLNHNIINKIFHQGWFEDIRLVNEEYHRNFIYLDRNFIYRGEERSIMTEFLIYYPNKYHHNCLNKCSAIDIFINIYHKNLYCFGGYHRPCGYSFIKMLEYNPKWIFHDSRFDIPKCYVYSSGNHNPNGCKKCI